MRYKPIFTSIAAAAPLLLSIILSCVITLSSPITRAQTVPPVMQITVDASEINRKIIHGSTTIEFDGDSLSLLYPKWIPGIHGPGGPIQNLTRFHVTDESGTVIPWERDWSDPFRFLVGTAPDETNVTIELSYICSQPTDLSWGSDCTGTSALGVINWNPITVYPEGAPVRDLRVEPRMLVPSGWKYATAMPTTEMRGDTIVFETVSFEELIDYPVICGRYMNSYEIANTSSAAYRVHVAVDEESLLPLADSAFQNWDGLITETEALLGRTHFDEYHFLVPISDNIRHYGLEHRNSSVNSLGPDALRDYGEASYDMQWLLAHEFVHSWCGKYRRPDGMCQADYHTTPNLEMLWFYEGLTEYLGEILAVRSGLVPRERFDEESAVYWGDLLYTTGRDWRSLHDVAISTYTVWGGSDAWKYLRRNADYYREGALIWLEIDARIRSTTDGERSLDDFCKSLLGSGDPQEHTIPLTRAEIVAGLNDLHAFNWDSLLDARLVTVNDTLDESLLGTAGYRFGFTTDKPDYISQREDARKTHNYLRSVGLEISAEDFTLGQIVPASPADIAGLVTGMTLIGVNDKTFSIERFEHAIEDAEESRVTNLLVEHGESLIQKSIHYDGGLRYLTIEAIPDSTLWLDEILKPIAGR
jgi:predicted metalloprotease with PDZ domain